LTFILPFGGRLKPDNRWVRLTSLVPQDDVEPAHHAVMDSSASESDDAGSLRPKSGIRICSNCIRDIENVMGVV